MYTSALSPFVPAMWAAEAVAILWESMVYAGTVYMDFSKEIAKHGDEVNTRRPGRMEAQRKQNDLDDLEDSNPEAENIKVRLNQRVYTSFMLGDGASSLSIENLFDTYLKVAIQGEARFIDRVIAAQVYQYLHNAAGGLQQMSKTNSHDFLLDIREVFNNNFVDEADRWLGLASRSETLMQKNDLFKSAERIGDGGRALRNALLGRVAGWQTFLEQNTPSVRLTNMTEDVTTVNGAHDKGVTMVTVADASDLAEGQYVIIEGDWSPLRIVDITSNVVTFSRPLIGDVANGAAVHAVDICTVDQSDPLTISDKNITVSDGYPVGWAKEIVVDTASSSGPPVAGNIPKLFQLVAFGVQPYEYGIIKVRQLGSNSYAITLDRPLEASIADEADVNLGPAGDYNFAYHRNSVAFVMRPLVTARPETGILQATATWKNLSLRVEISRDSKKQGHRVTVDGIFGVKPIASEMGGVLLG